MSRIKLVLRGGGTRYPVYVGALKVLRAYKIRVSEVLGTSAGALVAGFLAAGLDLDRVHERMRETTPSDLLDPRWFPFWPLADGTAGVFRGQKILDFARREVPPTHARAALPVHVSTHNWTQGRNVVWTRGDLPLHIRASMSLPIFDMVRIDGELYEDGGVSGNFLLDYRGWDDAYPGAPVLGMSLLTPDAKRPRPSPRNRVARLMATVGDTIDALDREHISDANWARTVYLKTRHEGLELAMTAADVDDMVREGERAMDGQMSVVERLLSGQED